MNSRFNGGPLGVVVVGLLEEETDKVYKAKVVRLEFPKEGSEIDDCKAEKLRASLQNAIELINYSRKTPVKNLTQDAEIIK